jgi:predicted acetyltransferase
MPDTLILRRPTLDEEDELLRAHRATSTEVPTFLHYYCDGMPLAQYLDVLGDQERGINLAPGHVPETLLFAFMGPRIVGRVTIRHALNDVLSRRGGHIGYVLAPEFRRQGYATEILRQAVRLAHERLGLDRVLVTCDDDNIGSIRAIEKNGGCLDTIISGPDLGKPKRRYWIDARRP